MVTGLSGVQFSQLCTIQVTNKIGRPLLFNHKYDNGQHEVLLPINHNYNKICYILGLFLIKTQEISGVFWLHAAVKKSHLNTCIRWCTLSNYRHDVYCPITAEIRTVDSQSDLRILL